MKTKLIICDLWQTLVGVNGGFFDNILNILDHTVSLGEFIELMNTSKVFLSNKEIETTIPAFLSQFNATQWQTEQILKIWKLAPSNSYLYTYSESWIKNLKRSNYAVSLITNIDKFGYENFIAPDFLNLFDYQFLSFQEGIAKPDTRCFIKICEKFNVSPTEVFMVGDSKKDDIEPAQFLHMRTFQVTRDYGLDTIDFSKINLI